MTAALKMAAPGELCSQIKKLMVFCKDTARSIKAMRQHLAVTEAVMGDLLSQSLAQKLLWRQSNGMYKTFNTKMSLVDEEQTKPANSSLLALAQPDEGHSAGELDALWSASCEQADTVDIEAELDALVEQGLVQTEGDRLCLPDAIFGGFNLDQMATEFEQEQSDNDYPVIDDITAKERALGYCSLLLSPNSTELKRCIEALQMDLAVIRLHQDRRP